MSYAISLMIHCLFSAIMSYSLKAPLVFIDHQQIIGIDRGKSCVSGLKYTLCNQCCLSNGVEVICTTGQLVPLFPNTLDRINCIYRLFMGGGGGMLRDSCQKNRAISKNKKPIMHTSTCLFARAVEPFLPGLLAISLLEQRAC